MFDWEKILAQVAAVKAAPLPFLIAVLAVAALIGWINDRHYSGIIANKDSEIALYKGERDNYKDKLNGASPDQAKKQLEELQSHVATLAKHIDPRSLKAEQEHVLEQTARVAAENKPVISIAGDIACTDCSIYGGEFARILDGAGWQVTIGFMVGPPLHPATGLGLSLSNPQNPTPSESKLVAALSAANVPFDLLGTTGGGPPQLLVTMPAPR